MKRTIKNGIAVALALLTLNSTLPVLSANAEGEISAYSTTYSMTVTNSYTIDTVHPLYRTSLIGSNSATISCFLGAGDGYYIHANLHKDLYSTNDYYAATESAVLSNAGVSKSVVFQNSYTASGGPYYMRARISHMTQSTAGQHINFQYGYSY